MPKPRLTAEERRVQILVNAAKAFAVHGLGGTRTREIAKACGINEAVLYQHFESKDQLFRDALQFVQDEMLDNLRKIAGAEPTGLGAIRAVLNKMATGVISNREMRAYLLHGMASMTQDRDSLEWVKGWCNRHDELFQDQIKRGISDGSIKSDTFIQSAVWHIKGVLWACVLAAMLEVPIADVEKMSKHLFSKVLNEIAAVQGLTDDESCRNKPIT